MTGNIAPKISDKISLENIMNSKSRTYLLKWLSSDSKYRENKILLLSGSDNSINIAMTWINNYLGDTIVDIEHEHLEYKDIDDYEDEDDEDSCKCSNEEKELQKYFGHICIKVQNKKFVRFDCSDVNNINWGELKSLCSRDLRLQPSFNNENNEPLGVILTTTKHMLIHDTGVMRRLRHMILN